MSACLRLENIKLEKLTHFFILALSSAVIHVFIQTVQILDLHLSFPSIDITQIVVVCVDVFVKYTGLSHREYQMSHYGGVKRTL